MTRPLFPFFINSPWISAASVAGLALVACALILETLLKTGLAWRLATDIPNDRSLHTRPTPRIGGWGIVPVSVIAMLVAAPPLWLAAGGTAFLAAVSQIDDRRGLPARVRFGAHLLAVAALIALNPAPVPWWALAAVGFLMLWLVNLYNFMDGSDGLAGGMALFGFGGYAVAALSGPAPQIDLGIASAAIAGAAAGFLLFNFHPARIFLGDSGSIPLGFLAGALGYWGWLKGTWPVWFPALVFAPFIADASVTLLRRLARGERFWQAHREHYYQRMVRLGMGHARTAMRVVFADARGHNACGVGTWAFLRSVSGARWQGGQSWSRQRGRSSMCAGGVISPVFPNNLEVHADESIQSIMAIGRRLRVRSRRGRRHLDRGVPDPLQRRGAARFPGTARCTRSSGSFPSTGSSFASSACIAACGCSRACPTSCASRNRSGLVR